MTVSIECPECGEENVFEVIEGEPAIPYLPDGSGYPGSGPEITEETYVCGCNAISDDTILDAMMEHPILIQRVMSPPCDLPEVIGTRAPEQQPVVRGP